MESLIVRGLSKQFDGRVVLDKLDFEVVPGEFLSILGPSGCGKTTLLRILMGLSEPDEGSILLDGQEITRLPPDKRQMGIVFQNYALFENMTVLRNVEYALHLHPELKAQARQTAFRLLEQMGLSEQMDKYPAQLSGGQMQRVAVARTLALSPSIILFDEPMSALDVATRLESVGRRDTPVPAHRTQTDPAGFGRHHDLYYPRSGGSVCDVRPHHGDGEWTDTPARDPGTAVGRPCG